MMVQDKDIDSPEVATLAAQAADLLTRAHAAAVEDAANSQGGDITSGEPHKPLLHKPASPVVESEAIAYAEHQAVRSAVHQAAMQVFGATGLALPLATSLFL